MIVTKVSYVFNLGFSELNDLIDGIDTVRLRASNEDPSRVYFSFDFLNEG
jgi:hypothetical protein